MGGVGAVTHCDIKLFAGSPATFRRALLIDAGGAVRHFLPEDWQERDFAQLDPALMAIAGRSDATPAYRRHYWERCRGHSKSMDACIAALWALAFSQRPVFAVASAQDLDQSLLLRKCIVRLLALNKWLAGPLKVLSFSIVNQKTKSTLEFLSGDPSSSWGQTLDLLICDEFCAWNASQGSREVWVSLASAMAKRPSCVCIITSNAGSTHQWQWPIRESIRQDPAWHFSSQPGSVASWITPAVLEEQRRLLPAGAYERLWENQWISSDESALNVADVQACCTLAGPCEPRQDCVYAAGVDLSTRTNYSALTVVGKAGGGAYHVAFVKTWNPKKTENHLAEVSSAILDVHKRYRLSTVAVDPLEAGLLMQQLSAKGVRFSPIDGRVRSNSMGMAAILQDVFRNRSIAVYPDAQLLKDLGAVRLEHRKYGQRLGGKHDKDGSHVDSAVALALALLVLKDLSISRQVFKINSELTLNARIEQRLRSLQGRSLPGTENTVSVRRFLIPIR